MQVLNSLLPIFAVIGLGIFLRKREFLTAEITQGFNRFAYFFALPLFLLYKLAAAPAESGNTNAYLITLFAASAVTLFISWCVAFFLGTRFGSRGAFMQASFRGNLAFMGLPLIMFVTYDFPVEQKTQLESAVMLTLAPIIIFYNLASVSALAIYNDQTENQFSWGTIWRNLLYNPLLIACVAGLAIPALGLELPVAAGRTCEVIGNSAFPMALLGIGSQLASISVSGQWTESLVASGLKCIVCPFIGWIVGASLGLSGVELQVILILCSVPTAVSSYVLADQMNSDGALAASSVVVCTAFSFVTLSVLLAIPF